MPRRSPSTTVSTLEDVVLALPGLVDNDTDADGDALTLVAVDDATGDTVELIDGVPTFTPAANAVADGAFTYTISDGADVATATVAIAIAIAITPVNDPPRAGDDVAAAVTGGGPVVIDVLANDSFAPDLGENLAITDVTQAATGGVTFSAAAVSFTPSGAFTGTTSFTYTISDGNGGDATATVFVKAAATQTITAESAADWSAGAIASVTVEPEQLTLAGATTTYAFTTCGATGRLGPTQASCDTSYAATPLAGVTLVGGIQRWTVPGRGLYRVTVSGAGHRHGSRPWTLHASDRTRRSTRIGCDVRSCGALTESSSGASDLWIRTILLRPVLLARLTVAYPVAPTSRSAP